MLANIRQSVLDSRWLIIQTLFSNLQPNKSSGRIHPISPSTSLERNAHIRSLQSTLLPISQEWIRGINVVNLSEVDEAIINASVAITSHLDLDLDLEESSNSIDQVGPNTSSVDFPLHIQGQRGSFSTLLFDPPPYPPPPIQDVNDGTQATHMSVFDIPPPLSPPPGEQEEEIHVSPPSSPPPVSKLQCAELEIEHLQNLLDVNVLSEESWPSLSRPLIAIFGDRNIDREEDNKFRIFSEIKLVRDHLMALKCKIAILRALQFGGPTGTPGDMDLSRVNPAPIQAVLQALDGLEFSDVSGMRFDSETELSNLPPTLAALADLVSCLAQLRAHVSNEEWAEVYEKAVLVEDRVKEFMSQMRIDAQLAKLTGRSQQGEQENSYRVQKAEQTDTSSAMEGFKVCALQILEETRLFKYEASMRVIIQKLHDATMSGMASGPPGRLEASAAGCGALETAIRRLDEETLSFHTHLHSTIENTSPMDSKEASIDMAPWLQSVRARAELLLCIRRAVRRKEWEEIDRLLPAGGEWSRPSNSKRVYGVSGMIETGTLGSAELRRCFIETWFRKVLSNMYVAIKQGAITGVPGELVLSHVDSEPLADAIA